MSQVGGINPKIAAPFAELFCTPFSKQYSATLEYDGYLSMVTVTSIAPTFWPPPNQHSLAITCLRSCQAVNVTNALSAISHRLNWLLYPLVFTCVSYSEARNSYRLDVRPSVCPSVRPSHAGTLSKRLNILSCFLHHTIAHSF